MKNEDWKDLLILLLISLTLLFTLNLFRFSNSDVLPIYDQYEHIVNLNKNSVVFPLDSALSYTKNPLIFFRLLPFLISIINTALLYFLGKKIILKKKRLFLTILIFILSPPFLFIHGTHNSIYLALPFILFGLYLVLDQKYFFSAVCFLLSFAINQNLFPILILVLIVLLEKLKSKTFTLPILGIFSLTYLFMSFNNVSITELFNYDILSKYVFDLGSLFGFGIFSLILAAIGLIISWKDKNKNYVIYASLIALFLFSLFDNNLIFFIDLVLVYYSGLALYTIIEKKWESELLKNYVIILLICGLIFSAGSFIKEFSNAGPKKIEIQSLEWLKTQERGKVLSHYSYGFMISGISGFETYVDKNYFVNSKNKLRISSANEFFYSRNLEKSISFIEKNNIKYIWINEKMVNGLVWSKDDEGILLLMKNSHYFEKIYDFKGIQIWKIEISS